MKNGEREKTLVLSLLVDVFQSSDFWVGNMAQRSEEWI